MMSISKMVPQKPPKLTRRVLASLLRTQKQIFMSELYYTLDDDEDGVQQRIYDAVVSTFEICAKIVEGSKMVGYIDSGSEGTMQ